MDKLDSGQTLILGTGEDGAVGVSLKTLQRHFGCFGSSGSGKTVMSKVVVEELARHGIPVIAFDPQGDIASLACSADADAVEKSGTDLAVHADFSENVEVVVWTPASSKGVPICINPLQFDELDHLSSEDRTRYFSSTAKNIASLVGYNLDSDDGKSAEAVLSVLFEYAHGHETKLHDFEDVVTTLQNLPDAVAQTVSAVGTRQFVRGLTKKLSLLMLGARKLIFQTGVPANIDVLLGRDGSTEKTRISVIYLNTLHSTEEKEFFIAGIAQLLYRWMLKHPLADGQEGLQCAMFIDEIAPYIPPVKVPACKESLELLFRQGRKYGVSCMIATQSPGDIDYKAIGQFSTFVLGTLNTRQDIEKIRGRLESVAPKEIDLIINKLPALKPGNFLVVSPDEYENVVQVKSRWLVTEHRVIAEENLAELQPAGVQEFYNRSTSTGKSAAEAPATAPSAPQASADDQMQTEVVEPEIEVLDEEAAATQPVPRSQKKRKAEPEKVLIARDLIKEKDLKRKIRPHLSGRFIKSEYLEQNRFRYLPLVKVNLTFIEEKGLIRKTRKNIPESLYLDYESRDLLHVSRRQFQFSQIVDSDPNKIEDLDDHCFMEEKPRNEVDFRFNTLNNRKMNKSAIKRLMERKYNVVVNDVELVLFPVWECTVKERRNKKTHKITLDGIFGNPILGI